MDAFYMQSAYEFIIHSFKHNIKDSYFRKGNKKSHRNNNSTTNYLSKESWKGVAQGPKRDHLTG